MTIGFREYQQKAVSFAIYPATHKVLYPALGLCGETGEVAEKVKKYLRDDTKVNQKEIVKELGDVLFYTTALANYFYSNLPEVMEVNMDKLNDRAKRGVIKGSGDNR